MRRQDSTTESLGEWFEEAIRSDKVAREQILFLNLLDFAQQKGVSWWCLSDHELAGMSLVWKSAT